MPTSRVVVEISNIRCLLIEHPATSRGLWFLFWHLISHIRHQTASTQSDLSLAQIREDPRSQRRRGLREKMLGVANTPRSTQHLYQPCRRFTLELPLVIHSIHQALLLYQSRPTSLEGHLFGQVLGDITDGPGIGHSTHPHDIGALLRLIAGLHRRAQRLTDHLMRDMVNPIDQQMPVKPHFLKVLVFL